MTTLQILVLALVQGITEFLPISSSAHLILVGEAFGTDQGMMLDIAVHVGTLFAVLLYFWRDVRLMVLGAFGLLRGRVDEGGALALKVIVATLPVVVAGLGLSLLDPDWLRSVEVIAWSTIGFGVLLWVADRFAPQARGVETLSWRDAIAVGLAQALALIPGTSRSGITMTAARALGYRRTEAAHLSLLLSIPTIAAAGMLLGVDVVRADSLAVTGEVALAASLAFVAALAAIWGMMRWLRSASFTPFVLYRLGLGVILLWYVYA